MEIDPIRLLSKDQKKEIALEVHNALLASIKTTDFSKIATRLLGSVVEELDIYDVIDVDAISKVINKKLLAAVKK